MPSYLERTIDAELAELLTGVPAICIQGAKGVGKTASAQRWAKTVLRLDNPAHWENLQADRSVIERLETPLLIDEWQLDPPIWDAVRRSIDTERTSGRFLLTGSANPHNTRVHSGAGRIINLRMRPLSFAERQLETPSVSLSALLNGKAERIGGHTSLGLADYTREILASGFPGIRTDSHKFRRRQIASYLDHSLSHEVPALGVLVRRPGSLRAWLQAYAAATSTTASYETIADATSPAARPSRDTVIDYRDALTSLWLLDPVSAWIPQTTRMERLGRAPKHQLADPALAAQLLGANEQNLLSGSTEADRYTTYQKLRTGTLLGALYESLVTLSVRVIAEPLELDVTHLRTHRGEHEIDLILSTVDGDVIAIEVKLAEAVGDRDVRHLNWLSEKLGDRLLEKIIVTTGPNAYRRSSDGVIVVPLALLGA